MPERRKSKEEYAAELGVSSDQQQSDRTLGDETAGEFVPISEDEREEVCELFNLLIDEGFITCGEYSVRGDESGRKVVSLSAFLPSTIEGNPRSGGERDA